jgi:transposase
MILTLKMWPPRRRSNRTGSRSRQSASAPNTAPEPFVSDEQWLVIADLFPHRRMTSVGGRPRVEPRACLEGILWVLVSGARWKGPIAPKKGPERYPSPSTCWRRHRDWTEAGIFEEAWNRLLGKLDGLKQIHWDEAIGDGTFSPSKSRAVGERAEQGARASA